ncbi:MAG TPA: HYR domain-containing protein, partial [Flavobacteriales bacterium]|nr:HYR domain-containing protein [Flavobacteriales bacterium]
PTGSSDAFIVKRDLNGNTLWSTRVGGLGADGAQGVAVGSDGNIYVTGYFSGLILVGGTLAIAPVTISSGGTDLFVACFNPAGVMQWLKAGGGAGTDTGSSIAVNSSGVFVQGMYYGLATFGTSASAPTLNAGHYHACLLKYSTAGNLLWQIDGGAGINGNREAFPERIACDEDGAYVTGSFTETFMNWYTNGGALLGNITATGLNSNIYVAAVSNAGALTWSQPISNPGLDNVNGNAIAVSCAAVYIAGNTHNSSVFAGSTVTLASNPHDYMYVAALDKSNGTQKWVRTAYGPDNHMTDGYDLAVNRNGSVYLCGQFQNQATFSDGTVISTSGGGGYERDAFVARFTTYGRMDWAIVADGSKDGVPIAVGVDNNNGVYTGGQFEEEIRFTPAGLTLTDGISNNLNAWIARFTDPQRPSWPLNPSNWSAPSTICSNAGPLGLSALLPDMHRGYASTVIAFSGVTALGANRIPGVPDGSSCPFTANANSVTVDLADTIPANSPFSIIWGKMAAVAGTASFQLEVSQDNISWSILTAPTRTAASTTLISSTVTPNVNVRYIRITRLDAISPINFQVDAISFVIGSLGGGTWSGPGVTGSTFDPSLLSGPVNITYSVTYGTCPYSTQKFISVIPVAGGTVSGPATICPGASATFTLAGSVGISNVWTYSTDGGTTWNAFGNPDVLTNILTNITLPTRVVVRTNTGSCVAVSNVVTITPSDAQPPAISCPANISVNVGAGTCGAVVNYIAPVGTDNCPGATTTRTAGLASGATFPKGVSTVTYTVTDVTGLTASCSFTVTVTDNIAPAIACPANIAVNVATGTCGAVVNYIAPVGTDNCAGATTTRTAGLASGSIFPVGVTTVTHTVTDAVGLTASCSFTVTVTDNIAPAIVCPANIAVNVAAGTCGAVVNYIAPIGTDNCAGATTTRTAGLASGATFPVGVTTVTHMVTDAAGITASCSFTVTVTDNIAPAIACPANIAVNVA